MIYLVSMVVLIVTAVVGAINNIHSIKNANIITEEKRIKRLKTSNILYSIAIICGLIVIAGIVSEKFQI